MLHSTLLAVLLVLQGPGDFPTKHVQAKPEPTKAIAKVNGQDIKASDLEPFLWDWRAYEALEDLIVYRIVADEAARMGFKVDDAQVEVEYLKQLEAYKKQLPPNKDPEQALLEQGYPKSRIIMGTQREMLLTKIAEREFAPANFVKVSTITVKPASADVTALTEAIGTMNKIYDRLKAGDKWETLLKSVTTDQRVVDANGLIGWRGFSAFPESVQAEIKTLKAGQYTKPAQTPFGIQIFRIEAKGEAAKPEELTDLKGQFLMSAREGIMNKLRAQAKIERFLRK